MQAKPDLVTLDPALAALALGDHLILFQELVSGLAKGLLIHQQPRPRLPTKTDKRVLRKLLGEGEIFLSGRAAVLAAVDGGRTVPIPAVSPVYLNQTT
ncbi:bsr7215 [Bradyrhizobium diazoefficiens USDA 110]|uniref:Bsr7215 protein n=1 Tax=Bradyrhizobium diazoefficiens (strain JCM 10833 / BCRC 13528 / IAM 13628 / NBRC 14792 / USDA 110) TaxID=224911 RepID=Q89E72_BRADU|nr:hypothetical protein CO678_20175 [Bradyrhizobium diazoefficiens]QBP27346.1 hypothetical protein Bdiaspc4_38055 [Bradyrhizobium diazoefficiens]BAC52480.1 bsr7215 [Bradyrhizobium diazoefficiens USDA 110]